MANRSHLRQLVLRPAEGKKAKEGTGMVDTSLFKGKNRLHLNMDTQTCHWSFAYDNGALPAPLKCKFTSYLKAYNFAKAYFERRDIEIVEVIDN